MRRMVGAFRHLRRVTQRWRKPVSWNIQRAVVSWVTSGRMLRMDDTNTVQIEKRGNDVTDYK